MLQWGISNERLAFICAKFSSSQTDPVSSDTYVLWLVVVPDPIWPQLFWPQEKMSPSTVRQSEW